MKSEQEIRERLEQQREEIKDRMDLTNSNHKIAKHLEERAQVLEWVLDEDD